MGSRHLSEAELIDSLELDQELGHVSDCRECREKLEQLRDAWALAKTDEIPEPPGLYWPAMSRRVGRGVSEAGRPRWGVRQWLQPALAAGAVCLAVASLLMPLSEPDRMSASLSAWSPLPPLEEDTGLELLAALELPEEELDGVAECSWASCLAELSEEESRALADALRAEMEGRVL